MAELPGERLARGRALALALLVTALAAAATRLRPLARYAIWGSDSGEYVFLTQRLLDTGRISFEYTGWGLAYPYFPGLFVLDGAVALFTGIDVLSVQRVLVPALAGLLALLVYLIALEIVPDRRVALVAGAFLAVTSPHVLITSHAMPGTLGHLFFLAALLCLVRSYREPAWAWGLVPFGAALLLTHHLTLYFLVGVVAAIALLRELVRGAPDRARLRVEAPFVFALVAGAAVWWLGVAERFRDEIVGDVLDTQPWIVAAAAILTLAAVPPALVALRRRFLPPLRTHPRWPSPRFVLVTASAGFFGLVAFVSLFLFVPVPGGAMRVYPATIAYLPPVAVFLAFALAGGRVLRLTQLGAFASGWLAAVLASLAFAVATDSRVLFPFRHVEYAVEPLAIYVGAGVVAGADHLARLWPRGRGRVVAVGAVALALAVATAAALPPRETIANFEEGMSEQEVAGVVWARDHLPRSAVVAADHRVSSLLFGLAGLSATFDYADETYHSATLAEALAEMRDIDIPADDHARITHVFLSPEIRAGVALEQFANAEPMSEAAQAKFEDARYFAPVYGDPSDRASVTILQVRWDAIDADFSASPGTGAATAGPTS